MTSENLFSAVLTFSMLAGGTVAFGADLVPTTQAPAPVASATLPAVTVVGRRATAADRVTLPTVTVIGRRALQTEVAVDTSTAGQRVQ